MATKRSRKRTHGSVSRIRENSSTGIPTIVASNCSFDEESYKPVGSLKMDIMCVSRELGLPYVPEVRALYSTTHGIAPEVTQTVSHVGAKADRGDKKQSMLETPATGKKTKSTSKLLARRGSAKGLKGQRDRTQGTPASSPAAETMVAPHHTPSVAEGAVDTRTKMVSLTNYLTIPMTELEKCDSRPSFLVEMNGEDDRTVTCIFIRGFKIDPVMWQMLEIVLPAQPCLHTLRLWRVGLCAKEEGFKYLVNILPDCTKLTTLILDNNELYDLPVSKLLGTDTKLQHLSLRFCGLGDLGAVGLGGALGNAECPNTTLITLSLTGNHITDVGASSLADALKVNRSLLVLNLAGNEIGDLGCTQLSEALSWYPVEGDILAARKRLVQREWQRREEDRWQYISDSIDTKIAIPKLRKKTDSKKKVTMQEKKGVNSVTTMSTPAIIMSSPSATKSLGKASTSSATSKATDKGKSKGSVKQAAGKGRDDKKRDSQSADKSRKMTAFLNMFDEKRSGEDEELYRVRPSRFPSSDFRVYAWGFDSPLLVGGYIHEGLLWLPGNRVLISLNLSRNKISNQGVKAMLSAMEDQEDERLNAVQSRVDQWANAMNAEYKQKYDEDMAVTSLLTVDHSPRHSLTSLKGAEVKVSSVSNSKSQPKKESIFLKVVSEEDRKEMEERITQDLEEKRQEKGLMRLVIHHNLFNPDTCTHLPRLHELLQARDPLRKVAAVTDQV